MPRLAIPLSRVAGVPALGRCILLRARAGNSLFERPPAGTAPGAAPNVILQTRDTRSAARLPYLSSWPTVTYHYVATAGPVHMFTSGCAG